MIPVELVYVVGAVALGLSIFAVWNLDNRVYANIILGGFVSSLLWFYLAGNVIVGNVFYTYEEQATVLKDLPLFWILIMFGAAMMIYSVILSVEAITETVPDITGDTDG